jgi:hypothetical protein
MNKIIYDIELLPKQQNEITCDYYYKYTKQIKNKRDKIKLSLYCAKYCFDYNDEKTKPYSQKCIDLVERYLIDPNSVTQQDLLDAANASSYAASNAAWSASNASYASSNAAAWSAAYAAYNVYYSADCLYYCSQIQNINMNLPHQYLQKLLRSIKQFNTENYYSNHIKEIVKQDIDKLELVDYNMLLDISNEHYNIDLSEFNYDNIFSRRNLIEMIRREYE